MEDNAAPRGLMGYIPNYLRNSWNGLARGAQTVREATDPFQYAQPAAQMAAGMLPGAGLVQGSMDFQNGRQALGDGRYGDAAMDYGLGLINAGTDMIPAMAAVPPIRRGRGSFEMDYFGQPVRILQNPSPQETQGFLNRTKYKAARRIQDPKTGEVYIWDAADPALHKLVAERLGIEYDDAMGDMIGLD